MEILFVLRKNQTNKDNPATVYCRITLNGDRAGDFSTFISVLPTNWDAKAQLITKGDQESHIDNETLLAIRRDIKECLNELGRQSKTITAKSVKQLYIGKKSSPVTLLEILRKHLDFKISTGLKKESVKNERSRRKNVETFLHESKLRHITGHEVDDFFIEELEYFLLTKLKHKPVHAIRHLRMINESLKWAKKKKLIQINMIEDLTWQNVDNDKTPALSPLEIYQLENYAFQSPALQRTADRFMMQVYTGFSYIDLMDFNPDWDVIGNFIQKERQKTKEKATVPYISKLRRLLDKYDGKPPQIANATYNRLLKEIAAILNIKIKLTTRVARRTAGQLWVEAGLSIDSVSKMLGHSNVRTTQKSYVEVNETRIELDLKKAGLWEFE